LQHIDDEVLVNLVMISLVVPIPLGNKLQTRHQPQNVANVKIKLQLVLAVSEQSIDLQKSLTPGNQTLAVEFVE
jgi:hypothetical protein